MQFFEDRSDAACRVVYVSFAEVFYGSLLGVALE